MILVITFFCIIIAALLLNEYYYHIVLYNSQEHQILRGKKGKNYDWIAFGSSYCRYGLSHGEDEVGFNFGVAAQFLYYSDKMLREYAVSCLKKKGTVFLIIADLVFAEVGRGKYNAKRYPLILTKESLGDEYSFVNYLRMRFPLFFSPRPLMAVVLSLAKGINNRFETLEENELSYEQTLQQARKRCASWCRQFKLKDTISGEITPELEEKFALTRNILSDMIQFCIDNGFRPVLVVTPVSKAMNACISDEFMQKVLYDNIKKANKQNVPLLDYLKDIRFQDISLYANNADFLNARGRRLFTKVLIKDSENLDV